MLKISVAISRLLLAISKTQADLVRSYPNFTKCWSNLSFSILIFIVFNDVSSFVWINDNNDVIEGGGGGGENDGGVVCGGDANLDGGGGGGGGGIVGTGRFNIELELVIELRSWECCSITLSLLSWTKLSKLFEPFVLFVGFK